MIHPGVLRPPRLLRTFRPRPWYAPAPKSPMEPAALITLLVIGGFIWGGLVLILATAVRKERHKGASE